MTLKNAREIIMDKSNRINDCRVSKSKHLISILNLGEQVLTGVFPKHKEEIISRGPLELVWCPESGLLQLAHSYPSNEMYGENYGYRSGLNQSMVDHLSNKIQKLEQKYDIKSRDVVVDIGSNDGTLLKGYKTQGLHRIGIDPTGNKFRSFYPQDITLIPDFFSADALKTATNKPAKMITSIAMFYDLSDPVAFARDICSSLSHDGIWHFEQSYMPSMLRLTSYDTICHEHIEYYSLGCVIKILEAAELKIIDVEMNSINGGSFAVTATKKSNKHVVNSCVINWLLEQEDRMGLNTPRLFREFEERVYRHRQDLTRLIHSLLADNKKILGYGASTKGNVLLQFCGFSSNEILAIAEVNSEKYGRFTPGTHIPIVSEQEARAMNPDYFLVLPWHFKDSILKREKDFLLKGGKFIFPLPEIEII
jgi:hypothetical protein